MTEHVHIGLLTAGVTFLALVPIFFAWRFVEFKYHETPVGKAMAFIF